MAVEAKRRGADEAEVERQAELTTADGLQLGSLRMV